MQPRTIPARKESEQAARDEGVNEHDPCRQFAAWPDPPDGRRTLERLAP